MSNDNNGIVCLEAKKSHSYGANSDFPMGNILKYMEVVPISCYYRLVRKMHK